MYRERALKWVVIVSGLLFLAGIYPLVMSLWFWQHADDIVPMFLSLYVTLGTFLLIAARNLSEHRSLIPVHSVVQPRTRRCHARAIVE
jgi:hypothetical protein